MTMCKTGEGGCALEDHVSVPRFGVLDLRARVRNSRLATEAAEEAPHRQAMRGLPLVLITQRLSCVQRVCMKLRRKARTAMHA